MQKKKLIGPSILNADPLNLGAEIKAVSKADYLHIDVMDGHFVPNIAYGPDTVKQIKSITNLPLHCHLMVSDPRFWVEKYATIGVDSVTVHAETLSSAELKQISQFLADKPVQLGLAFNPDTEVEIWFPMFTHLSRVLIMSVFPGFGGQKFMSQVLTKVSSTKQKIKELAKEIVVEIDGGVNLATVAAAVAAGVDCYVVGSAVYGEGLDPAEQVRILQNKINGGE